MEYNAEKELYAVLAEVDFKQRVLWFDSLCLPRRLGLGRLRVEMRPEDNADMIRADMHA
jgi:hypothetical protein